MALPSVPVYWGVKVSERSVADTCWQLTTLAPVIANEPVGGLVGVVVVQAASQL